MLESEDEDSTSESEAATDPDTSDQDQLLGNIPGSPVNINPAPTNVQVNFQWTNTGTLKHFTFKKNQELLVPIPGRGKPIDFFSFKLTRLF